MQVTLFSLPSSVCVGCRFTKKKLRELDIEFDTVRLEQEPGAVDYIKSLGYSSAPVVEVDFGDGASLHWSGYSPSKIEAIDHAYGCDDPECGRCEGIIAA